MAKSVNIFKDRPRLADYSKLPEEAKALADLVVTEHIVATDDLRIKRLGLFLGFDWVKMKPRRIWQLARRGTLSPKESSLWSLSWSDIILLKGSITNGNVFESIKIVYALKEKDIFYLDLFNAFAAYKWIIDQMKQVHDAEVERLEYDPEPEELEAGVEELAEYGYYNTLDSLTKGDLRIQDDYLKMPYYKIFRKLARENHINQIRKKYEQIVSAKSRGGRGRT